MSEDHEKIRKLLALADAEAGRPEGETARRSAEKRLQKLGLKREDIERAERIILDNRRTLWEDALLNLVTLTMKCDLIERSTEDGTGTFLIIAGTESHIGQVAQLFSALQSAVANDADLYLKRIAAIIPGRLKYPAMFIFCGFAIMGISTAWDSDDAIEDDDEDQGTALPDSPTTSGTTSDNGPRSSPTTDSQPEANKEEGQRQRTDKTYKDSLERLAFHLERVDARPIDTRSEPSPQEAGFEAGLLIGDEINPKSFTGPKRITSDQAR